MDSADTTGRRYRDTPIVYSCSGCYSAAQTANAPAIRLDRLGAAEMSCIAGPGGDVPSPVRLARSGRPILALDGCPLVCVEATLRRHGIVPDRHIVLSRYGVRKRRHTDHDADETERLLPVVADAAAALTPPAAQRRAQNRHEATSGRAVPDILPYRPLPTARSLLAMITILLGVTAAVLLVAGPTMVVQGVIGRQTVTRALARQRISFPAAGALPHGMSRYADAKVLTGGEARAFSDLIGVHVAKATGGRSYAEIADEWQAGGRTDERLAQLRETAFMGQTLRGALLGAYQAWQITLLVTGLGVLFTAMGVAFLALALHRW